MVKTFKNLLLQNQESFEAESWCIVSGTQVLSNCSNDLKLTFYLFTAGPDLRPVGKILTNHFHKMYERLMAGTYYV